MVILSLFDGISAGRLALNKTGTKVDKYFASEIDKNAIKVTQTNFPDTIQLGDIKNVKGEDLPKIDLLIGGFCCQSFSFAGKQLAFNDERGKLFFEALRLLKETKPKYFLFENVRMKKEYSDKISELVGVNYIEINSSLVSAQNRNRLYWTNIPNITKPKDKHIMLKDVINQDYDGIWVWPRGGNPGGIQGYKGKSPSVTTSCWQHNFYIYKDSSLSKNELKLLGYIRKEHHANRVYSTERKSPCLKALSGGQAGPGNALIYVKDKVRKFTPEEAEQLQTIPVGHTKCLSNNQRFKCIGNCFTVDVIAHILKGINEN